MGPKVTVMRISCFNICIEDNNIEGVHKIYFFCFIAPNSFIFLFIIVRIVRTTALNLCAKLFNCMKNKEVKSKKEKTHFCTPCTEKLRFLKKMLSRKWLCLLSPPPQYLDLRIPGSEIRACDFLPHRTFCFHYNNWRSSLLVNGPFYQL